MSLNNMSTFSKLYTIVSNHKELTLAWKTDKISYNINNDKISTTIYINTNKFNYWAKVFCK